MVIYRKGGKVNRKGTGRRKGICRVLACCAALCCALLAGCGGKGEPGVRVGSLKGPTSMGILFLMDSVDQEQAAYEFHMATGADELLALMAKGELDIALIPANSAAVLYQKTNGGVTVIDINTLGVLYMVTGNPEIDKVSDLKGRTVCLTGRGTTPDAALRFVLRQNGLGEEDCTLEYKSEAAEVAALLAEDPDAVGLLPQPFATAALLQNGKLRIAIDMNAEWERLQGEGGSALVTGVTVVRDAFLEDHEDMVRDFLEKHRDSVEAVNGDVEKGAVLAVEAGIVAKEAIAAEAIPKCNLVCITGDEMEEALSAYLEVLAGFNADLVGGSLPEEDFYY